MAIKTRYRWFLMSTTALIMGIISIILFVWSHSIREQQRMKDIPREYAISEMAKEISLSHLRLEEYVYGSSNNLGQIKDHLDRSMRLSKIFLEGGILNEDGHFVQPFETPKMRDRAAKIWSLVVEFNYATTQKIEFFKYLDDLKPYERREHHVEDEVFDELINTISIAEQLVRKDIARNQTKSLLFVRIILSSLILTVILTVIGFWIKEQQLKSADIELKQWNEKLEQRVINRTRKLEELQKELVCREKLAIVGQLAGSIGHDLRNPLGVIGNSAYFLKMKLKDGDEKVMKHLGIMQMEVERSNEIISELFDFSRMSPPSFVKASVNSIVKKALTSIKIPRNFVLETQLDENLPEISVDPGQIQRVFQNIISNAVQAISVEGRLDIRTRQKCDFVEIKLIDTGEGISEENLQKIFDPFFTMRTRGIGFGLSIVKNIVDGHNGKIEVTSKTGKGTTFTVKLPLDCEKKGKNVEE